MELNQSTMPPFANDVIVTWQLFVEHWNDPELDKRWKRLAQVVAKRVDQKQAICFVCKRIITREGGIGGVVIGDLCGDGENRFGMFCWDCAEKEGFVTRVQ